MASRRHPSLGRSVFAAAALLALSAPWVLAAALSPAILERARTVRDRALDDDTAYECLRSLTTEVGPRLAGSPADARAVAWAVAKLKSLGFQNVRAEPVRVPRWIRGEARAEIVSPWPQSLTVAALGGSVATPPEGVEAEVVTVGSLEELAKMPRDRIAGRIVFFNRRMERTHDIAGYRAAVPIRSRGPSEAAKLGAVAALIRSVGTSNARFPHTGGTRNDPKGPRIAGLALSNPDADLLERQIASGQPVRMRVFNTSVMAESTMSANVIGEFPGRKWRKEIVLLAAHLDSWDLGTGAHDDGAGVAIVTAAARLVAQMKPARTLRVVLYANEENGTSGARAYARDHRAEIDQHVLGLESDLGAFRVLSLHSKVPLERLQVAREFHAALEPMGIVWGGNEASAGADIDTLGGLGMPLMALETDAAPYFDLHHNANDTFDKVDPALLRQNVAAYAMVALMAAEVEGGLGRLPKPQATGSTPVEPIAKPGGAGTKP
ncbi:MAG TPA: M28 family peptidase [Candidatus Eisenbacteria bacterium]|nr:M28 family peptidase [Candidatus Eisenbacteria bacterium]